MKTRKQDFELWNPATYGIRNPRMWNPESTDMESGIHNVKSGIHNVKSGIQDSLGLPYTGRNKYVKRSAYANVFKYNRENKRFERAKVISRCFHWFTVAMLESLRGAPTWRLPTKHYNFQCNLLPNNSSSEYRASPKLWHVVYLLLVYDISISWLNILNGKRCYFSLAW